MGWFLWRKLPRTENITKVIIKGCTQRGYAKLVTHGSTYKLALWTLTWQPVDEPLLHQYIGLGGGVIQQPSLDSCKQMIFLVLSIECLSANIPSTYSSWWIPSSTLVLEQPLLPCCLNPIHHFPIAVHSCTHPPHRMRGKGKWASKHASHGYIKGRNALIPPLHLPEIQHAVSLPLHSSISSERK